MLLGLFGISVDINPHAQAWQLVSGFSLASLVALVSISLMYLTRFPTRQKRCAFILLQLLAFRIAYFPIVVFSATVACYIEWGLSMLNVSMSMGLFPVMFISAAMGFLLISVILFWALNGKKTLCLLIIAMGVPATLISFADRRDVTILPDPNWADITPLPTISLPQSNPYGFALTTPTQSLGQKVIGLSGELLYDLIPKAPWSQAVQGTLEQAYRDHPQGNAHDQLRYHYAAFLVAHNTLFYRAALRE